ncbi:MAG TPA: DUF4139 domain-containing protein [Terriglobia bacterium]|nr:DUF4139 domain-containing protein [Terriglobia bacterium]
MFAPRRNFGFYRLAGGIIFALIAAAAGVTGQSPGTAPGAATVTSTLDDQREVAVTVYNQNLALVRDVRRLELPTGDLDLRFMDIAARVNPATVHIVSQTAPKDLDVLEQNYEYDLLNPQKLLEKYVGREVTLVQLQTENNSTREVRIKATLLADNDNGPVWKVDDQIITGIGTDRYIFPDLPPNLYSKPTLIWLLTNRYSGAQTVEASYLTGDMNWNADYVLTVGTSEKTADLNGWVTVTNNSGTEFRNAQLQLVAGAVNVIRPPTVQGGLEAFARVQNAPAPPQFTQENLSEYHLYTLDRRTTLQDKESKQISLLEANGFPIEKHYEVSGQTYYYQNALQPGEPIKNAVEVHLKFKNSQANSLGIPLPAGTMRVYQGDSKGRLQFIGEDHIDHTPKDETLDLHIGDAFDIVAERKQTDYQRIDRHTTEMAFEISLRNHKSAPVTLEVNEPIGGDWTMEQSSFKYEKTSATSARFMVPVEANGEAVLTYRVRVRW